MNFNRTFSLRNRHLCNTKLLSTEQVVQNGLAFTPSDMLRLTRKGLPISPQNLPESMYSDNDFTAFNDFDVLPSEQRGACMASVWEAQQDARRKIRRAYQDGKFVKEERSNDEPES